MEFLKNEFRLKRMILLSSNYLCIDKENVQVDREYNAVTTKSDKNIEKIITGIMILKLSKIEVLRN